MAIVIPVPATVLVQFKYVQVLVDKAVTVDTIHSI